MKTSTTDRGAFLHVAGLQGLSPALDRGAPRLAAHGDAGERCGWEAFFDAAEQAGLALVWDPEDPSATALARAEEARPLLHRPSLADGVERARRFVRALRGGPPQG